VAREQRGDALDRCERSWQVLPVPEGLLHCPADRFPFGLRDARGDAAVGDDLDVAVDELHVEQHAAVVGGVPDLEQPEELLGTVPWLVAERPRELLGDLAAPLWGHPERSLTLAGVTGTNGKSTVVELVAAMLDAAHVPCGRIGTLGYRFPGLESPPTERTTPEASDLFRLLAAMKGLGAKAAAMEVSSHALAQGRSRGLAFDVAIFTNLTRDHFDFHPDFDDYFAAKAKLFGQLKPSGRAVVNLDDRRGRDPRPELEPGLDADEPGEVVGAIETSSEGRALR